MKLEVCSMCLKIFENVKLTQYVVPSDGKAYEFCEKCFKKVSVPGVIIDVKDSTIPVKKIKVNKPVKPKVKCESCGHKYTLK